MQTTPPRATGRLAPARRLARAHGRLGAGMATGVATFAALELVRWPALASAPSATRVLLAWNVGVSVYLALASGVVSRFDVALARRRAALQDEGGLAILVLTVAAAVASLLAIVFELGSMPKEVRRAPYLLLAVVTITLSWTFVHVLFAIHYRARVLRRGRGGRGAPVPGGRRAGLLGLRLLLLRHRDDCQVSDVQVTRKTLRRLVALHGVVSFVFNVAILALMVNLGAALL